MTNKFVREKHLVELLLKRLGFAASGYLDPNDASGVETGVDVIAIIAQKRIGIQVTELDTGSKAGQARADEKKLAAGAGANGGVYGAWAQNNSLELTKVITRSISRKAAHTTGAEFDKVWLLISCGVPDLGSVASTFVMTPWLTTADLDNATLTDLSKSKYNRAFVHSILGVEGALYSWEAGRRWQKSVQPIPADERGPSFWDVQRMPKTNDAGQKRIH
jgi:hypothetical protein